MIDVGSVFAASIGCLVPPLTTWRVQPSKPQDSKGGEDLCSVGMCGTLKTVPKSGVGAARYGNMQARSHQLHRSQGMARNISARSKVEGAQTLPVALQQKVNASESGPETKTAC
eukprot:850550-Pelagomonas_calceolata.AAC.5